MGREFISIFENWANSYDDTVVGHDLQYKEVFRNYDGILDDVVKRSGSKVVEFGVGTGNLTAKLIAAGKNVYGIEPSKSMRDIAVSKLPKGTLVSDGDFLDFPAPPFSPDTIVSSYAFHHLTNDEKREAVRQYGKMLAKHGKIVFADTVFKDRDSYISAIQDAKNRGYYQLAEDLETEHYPTISEMETIFTSEQFSIAFQKHNDFVWVMEAAKL
ncbi:class I SAM-dependent methyltransferase [Bacillus glycinifermentans]|uniref:class I SAM-dependent methyltransferase n=1 Tax=Bacillus glycinifermentans TaxID=1664069 RepID=UPI001FF4D35C|nr:class I SAM-dependent methyltransferase [Bacillus glycinifermentans]UOY90107.1 class I SAM-dependent methyltransferase [Bacillus glycinifermentans]